MKQKENKTQKSIDINIKLNTYDISTLCSYEDEILRSVSQEDEAAFKRIFKAIKKYNPK